MISNRRYFFLQSFGVAAAASMPAVASAQSAEGVIRTGHIGIGGRGTFLLRGVLDQPNVKVTALCDLKPDRLDSAATLAHRDNPATLRDYHELLSRSDIDAVYIASPCDLHVEMAIAALKAGKHVYCEKPAGITPESIAQLIEAVKGAKTVFQVGQQRRAQQFLQDAISKIHEGAFGRIIMCKSQRHSGNDLNHEGSSADWFFFANRSGDVITEMSVHNLDVCNWSINSRPARAAGFGGTLLWKNQPPGRTNMDGYTLSYEYDNDVKMSYTQVFFHPSQLPGGGAYTYLYTTEGAVDLEEGVFYPRAKDGKPQKFAEPPTDRDAGRNRHTELFFESIRTGKKPVADITIGATAALTAIMGRESIYQKRVVTWDEMGVKV